MPTPLTPQEAIEKKYGSHWGRNTPYKEGFCCETVSDHDSRAPHYSQCSRANGHGPNGLYCKQHARKYGTVEGDVIRDVWVLREGSIFRLKARVTKTRATVIEKTCVLNGGGYFYDSHVDAWHDTLQSALTACANWHASEKERHERKAKEHETARAEIAEMVARNER